MKRLSVMTLCSVVILFTMAFTGCSQKRTIHKKPTATKYTSAARHKATMRTYRVLGKTYHPSYVEVGQVMHGISSWYGPNFHGKYTSNGEIYNMHARTAAHKTWPMDTMVKVKNLQNGKSTIVRINDRGPFVKGRIIDCSYTAGKEIGLDKMGIAKVSVEVLGFAGKIASKKAIRKNSSSKNVQRVDSIPSRIMLSNFGIQIGAFRVYAGARKTKAKLAKRYPRYKPMVKHIANYGGAPLYRVLLMGFKSKQEAEDFKYSHGYNDSVIARN